MPVIGHHATMSNPLSPDLLSAHERLAEVGSLLAAGFLRHLAHRAAQGAPVGLDVLRTSSDECPQQTAHKRSETRSEGESAYE